MTRMNPFQPSGWGGREPCTVFIASWSRPIYMWVALDALWRATRSPARVVLLDNHHPDSAKDRVIAAFERRGLFTDVVRFQSNSFANIIRGYMDRLPACGRFHVFMESDAAILEGERCWLEVLGEIMESQPRIGMLGSLVDVRDFVRDGDLPGGHPADAVAGRFLMKLGSAERGFIDDPTWADPDRACFTTEPPCPIANPPGRLLMLDTDCMRRFGLQPDGQLADCFRRNGMTPAVTARVRHRHLSLLNIFDYDEYSAAGRNTFFHGPQSRGAGDGIRP